MTETIWKYYKAHPLPCLASDEDRKKRAEEAAQQAEKKIIETENQ